VGGCLKAFLTMITISIPQYYSPSFIVWGHVSLSFNSGHMSCQSFVKACCHAHDRDGKELLQTDTLRYFVMYVTAAY